MTTNETEEILSLFEEFKNRLHILLEMRKAIEDTEKSKLFGHPQIQSWKDSFNYHHTHLIQKLPEFQTYLDDLKAIWEQRQEKMNQYHQLGILDNGVVKNWTESQEKFQADILQCEKSIEFLSAVKPYQTA